MRKIGLTLAAVAALATTAVVNSPAEARGGRNAAIGFGVAAGVRGAAAGGACWLGGDFSGADAAGLVVRIRVSLIRSGTPSFAIATSRSESASDTTKSSPAFAI